MRHHSYNQHFQFVREPENFNKFTERELLQYCLGATLYMPGTKDIKEKIVNRQLDVTSFVMCCEDAIKEEDRDELGTYLGAEIDINKWWKENYE